MRSTLVDDLPGYLLYVIRPLGGFSKNASHSASNASTILDLSRIYVHLDQRKVHYIMKVIMDEMYGEPNFRSEIIWQPAVEPTATVCPHVGDQYMGDRGIPSQFSRSGGWTNRSELCIDK